MNLRTEARFALLINILILLWLSIEYLIGLQDKYIAWHPYVSIFVLVIPIVCYWMAFNEKIELSNEKLTFKQAFFTGFILTIFNCFLAVPVQLVFSKFINPYFFESMIQYSVKNGKQTPEIAAMYFNLKTYIIESVFDVFVIGILLSLILSWRMRIVK